MQKRILMSQNQNNNCIVIIPVYKETPSLWETESFFQCISILGMHNICILTYKELNLINYIKIIGKTKVTIQTEFFDKDYFNSLNGYNRLMMSYKFYNRFRQYSYMLIYQLDVYVFKDELNAWCAKGYDYIGAPWYKDFKYSHHDGNINTLMVGNGGFSLRKVSTFINLFEENPKVKNIGMLFKETKLLSVKSVLKFLAAAVWGYNNYFKNYIQYHKIRLYEDQFFCLNLAKTNCSLKTAPVSEAIKFSFEQGPEYLYNLNNKQLPFGCHAFEKNEFNSFWVKFIKPKYNVNINNYDKL